MAPFSEDRNFQALLTWHASILAQFIFWWQHAFCMSGRHRARYTEE